MSIKSGDRVEILDRSLNGGQPTRGSVCDRHGTMWWVRLDDRDLQRSSQLRPGMWLCMNEELTVVESPEQSQPSEAARRKAIPLCTGVLDYFPDALMAVAECSRVGNEQHNPGQPMHWAKEKSTDEPDALMRHLVDRGKLDTDGVRHSAKVAWRALALLQREIEAEKGVKNG